MNSTQQKVAIGLGVVAVGAAVATYIYKRGNGPQKTAPNKKSPKKGRVEVTKEVDIDEDDAAKAQRLKDAGNDAFKAKKYEDAIRYYTEGIALGVDTHLLYSNRSAAFAMVDKYKEAMDDAMMCIKLNPEWSKGYFRLGKALLATGEFDQAYKNFYQGLKFDPNSDELKKLLVSTQRELGLGDFDSRSKVDSKMIKLYYKRHLSRFCEEDLKTDLVTMKNLVKESIKDKTTGSLLENDLIKTAYETAPLPTLRVLAQLLMDKNEPKEALIYAKKAYELEPENPEIIQLYSSAMLRNPSSDIREILNNLRNALKMDPNSVLVAHTLASVLLRISQLQIPLSPSEVRAILIELQPALANPNTNQLLIADCGIRLWFKIFEDPEIQRMLMQEESENVQRQLSPTEAYLKGLTNGAFSQLCLEPFFMQALSQIVFNNPGLERVLAPFRTAFASLVYEDNEDFKKQYEKLSPLMQAMALQCYRNNYAWTNAEEDEKSLARLLDSIAEILEKKDPEHLVQDGALDKELEFHMVVIAMYMPLINVQGLAEIAPKINIGSLEPWLAELIKKSLLNPIEEKSIRENVEFTALTPIPSSSTADFYNDHISTSWDSAGVAAGRMVKITLKEEFEWIYPHFQQTGFDGKVKVLLVGSASGADVAQMHTIYDFVEITAIDSSAKNVAYAIRQNQELGFDAKFLLGDVASLEPEMFPEGPFDVVTTSVHGNLSHLNDPLSVLEKLAELVRPGGVINLTAFDKRYVEFVATCRKLLNPKFDTPLFDRSEPIPKPIRIPTQDEIRLARNLLMDSGREDIEQEIFQTPAFYSLSEFTDLIFHPQLQAFSFSSLGELLDRVGLNLVSFQFPQISQDTVLRYQVEFPDDPKMQNFAHLDEFERKFPESFRNIASHILLTCERPL